MFSRHQVLAGSYKCFWAILLLAFVVLGGRELWPELRDGKIQSPEPFASSDAYVAGLLNVPDGAERWFAVEQHLPKEGSVVFFCPERTAQCDFLFGLFSYLSWPRTIKKIEVNPAELERQVAAIDRTSAVAAVFFAVQPPAGLTEGWRFGPQVLIVPLQKTP